MTGFDSKRKIALDRLDDDDIQVYAQPAREPVAWQFMNGSSFRKRRPNDFTDLDSEGLPYWKPLYTAPPKRPWVGLTAQEAAECWTTSATKTWHNFEAKLKEKNDI